MATGKMPRNAYPADVAKAIDGDLVLDASGGKGELWEVSIEPIDELISNHRLRTGPAEEAKIDELARSIDEHGLQQPIRLYHQGQAKPEDVRFTLGFGHRRLEAHRRLKRQTIQAFVFDPAPESEIRAAQAIENLHREDLHPLEEAEALQALAAPGSEGEARDPAQVGAMVGRPRNWVEGRLALLRLSPRVRQMLFDELIYLGHAQLIARLASFDDQEDVAGRVCATKSHGYGIHRARKGDMRPPAPIAETRHYVEQHQRTLDGVPWRLDVEFAGKGACSACPQNSANAPGLFEDRDAPKKVVCLNAACYGEKMKAASSAVQRASNTLAKADGKPTPAAAKKAIAEREVEFVRPGAVAEAAKRKQAPKQATPAEKRGAKAASAKASAQAKLDAALHEWKRDFIERMTKLIAADCWRRVLFILITSTKTWRQCCTWQGRWGKGKKAVKTEVDGLMPFLRSLSEADESQRQRLLSDFIARQGSAIFRDDEDAFGDMIDEALEVVTDDLWLEIFPDLAEVMPAKPKLEDFQPPPPEAASARAPAKKAPKTKKKPRAAGARPQKKTKTRRAAGSGGGAKKAVPA